VGTGEEGLTWGDVNRSRCEVKGEAAACGLVFEWQEG